MLSTHFSDEIMLALFSWLRWVC